MACGVFLGRAHIKQVRGAAGIGLPLGKPAAVEPDDASTVGHCTCLDPSLGLGGCLDFAEASLLAMCQLLPGQRPADGAVAQRGHGIGDARIDQ